MFWFWTDAYINHLLLQSLDTSSALNDKNPAFTRLPLNRTKIMYSPYFDISQPWSQRSTYYSSLLCKLYKKNQFHVVSWSFDPLNAQGLYKLALLDLANRVFNSLLKKVSKNHTFSWSLIMSGLFALFITNAVSNAIIVQILWS